MIISKSIEIGGKTLTVESGRMAKQADGAALIRLNDTMVLVTVVAAQEAKENMGFFPLTVEYREKYYATGKVPGGFIKRESRPSEKEILAARLIDRPIRPLFPKDFMNETQVIANVLSMDKENDADVLAGFGTSVALGLSDVPFEGILATVRIARVNGEFLIYPTLKEAAESDIVLIVSGSEDSIMMVEGEAKEVSEDDLQKTIETAHEAIKKLVTFQKEIFAEKAVPKREVVPVELPQGLQEKVTSLAKSEIISAIKIREKKERRMAIKDAENKVIEALLEEYPETEGTIKDIIHDIEKDEVRKMILDDNVRLDGRGLADIRDITCEVSVLPRTHGSALFTRGQTQSLGVITLGSKSDEQIVDGIEGDYKKNYMFHYNFPPFCTGEAKPIRGTSRREIGHGNLAERAIRPVMPKEFPYTVRIVSEVLESNGSSSMASVCSGSLSLMDTGVPIKSAVAGIAMGLIKESNKVAILSDILGDEDHLGDMDFKVAGTSAGITAVQMDIKIAGISSEIMHKALQQAKEGRLHIMSKMNEVLAEPREELNKYAPKIFKFQISVDKIGTVIGPGGKTIRSIIEQTDVQIDIEEDGTVIIASPDGESADKAKSIIEKLTEEAKEGKTYKGVVKRIKDFGAFVEILPGKDGMVHISELDIARTNKVTDVVKEGDEIDVVVKSIGPDGKIALSRKMFLQQQTKEKENVE
jgi:polyribonucleotide nucleotidyltransferase